MTLCLVGSYILSLTPKTMVKSGFFAGALITTFAFAATVEFPTYYPVPSSPTQRLRGLTIAVGDSAFQSNADSPTPLPIGYGVFQTRIGIGTVTPGQMLDIYSQAAATLRLWGQAGGIASHYASLELRSDEGTPRSTSGDRAWQLAHEKTTNRLQISYQLLGGSFAPQVTVTPAGNVGIGTTAPTQRLVVAGIAKVDALYLDPRPTAPSGATDGMIYYDSNPSIHKFRLRVDGNWEEIDTDTDVGTGVVGILPVPAWKGNANTPGDPDWDTAGSFYYRLSSANLGPRDSRFVYYEFKGTLPSYGINQAGYGGFQIVKGIAFRHKESRGARAPDGARDDQDQIQTAREGPADSGRIRDVRYLIWKIQ